jgi:EAL domain-containing protein (putative c-di-GMP-specific phosphodiesterase class I)
VDFLKIDGNFVREMISDPVSRSMVASINEMGHLMGLSTVAECAETSRVVNELKEIGVDFIQGHAIGRPLPIQTVGHPHLRLVSGNAEMADRATQEHALQNGANGDECAKMTP